jgi:hypothetical protein
MLSDTLLRQTRLHFPSFEETQVKISPIERGGSGRKFYRIQFSEEQSIVLVRYPREQTENLRYVEIAEFLGRHGVRAPKIHFHDPEEGLIWIEDLGENDLWSHRNEAWPTRRRLYQSALAEIAKLHRIPVAEHGKFRSDSPAQFDAALYLWEQHYFLEHCVGRHFGAAGAKLRELSRLPRLEQIAARLGGYPRVLVHRDFQSQNIIIRDGQAYLIDFQGLRPGLAEYDLASLLYDPYVKLGAAERTELLEFYQVEAKVSGRESMEKFRLCAMQRLMQALGAYGYLGHTKGVTSFLEHIPTALCSLGEVLAGIEGLDSLCALVGELAMADPS